MNKHLKFSWGHILCFLALILISYVSFLGTSYLTRGNFVVAAFVMLLVALLLLVVFIGAQMLKASAQHFRRWIVFERFLVFASPFVFLSVMLPFFHFAAVHSKNNVVVKHFEKATRASIQLLDDYDSYTKKRIENYEKMLDKVSADEDDSKKQACGFSGSYEQIQKQSMVKALRLQLLPNSYQQLRKEALAWSQKSLNGVSTWNVFMMGNTQEMKQAIHQWSNSLSELSARKLNNEEFQGMNTVMPFSPQGQQLNLIDKELDIVEQTLTTFSMPPVGSLLGGLALYLALLLPYLIQDRHSKSRHSLLHTGKDAQLFEYEGVADEDQLLAENDEEDDEDIPFAPTSDTETQTQ